MTDDTSQETDIAPFLSTGLQITLIRSLLYHTVLAFTGVLGQTSFPLLLYEFYYDPEKFSWFISLGKFNKKQLLAMSKIYSVLVNMLFAALILLNECLPFMSVLIPGNTDKDCAIKVRNLRRKYIQNLYQQQQKHNKKKQKNPLSYSYLFLKCNEGWNFNVLQFPYTGEDILINCGSIGHKSIKRNYSAEK